MGIRQKANTPTPKSSSFGEDRSLKDMYIRIGADSEKRLIPLVDYADIDRFPQLGFGAGSNFWTTVDVADIGDKIGVQSKLKYIMPVLDYDEILEWAKDTKKPFPEAMYYSFPKSVYDDLLKTEVGIRNKAIENEDDTMQFKGAVITITRDDQTANKIVAYKTAWYGDMYHTRKPFKELAKITGNTDLPESKLDIYLGILGFKIEHEGKTDDEIDALVKPRVVEILNAHTDYTFPEKDKFNHLGRTLGERLAKAGLLTGEGMPEEPPASTDDWSDLESKAS